MNMSFGRTTKAARTTTRFLRRDDVAFVFHLLAFIGYAKVWTWHTTEAAVSLPGATGFGWFFRYLTFYSFTLQLLQLFLCILARLTKDRKTRFAFKQTADILSAAVFGIANTVTALYYAIESATSGLVEGGVVQRPWWLSTAVHLINTLVAWIDLAIVEDRTFCGESRHWALVLGSIYCIWILLVKYVYGKFPYPILNKLPFPWGYMGFVVVGLSVLVLLHEAGRVMKELLDGKPTGRRGGRKKREAITTKRRTMSDADGTASTVSAHPRSVSVGTRRSSRVREASH